MTGGDVCDEVECAMDEQPKKQTYEVADIYPFMQYKVYTLKPADGTDLSTFCLNNSLDEAVFVNLNGGQDKVHLAAGKTVLVPHYFHTKDKCEELTVHSLRSFALESRLMHDPYLPIFYLYYATVHGDILGHLLLTDCELMFTPLNEMLKGTYNYEFGNLHQNHKASFTVSFEDLVGEPFKISIPNEHAEDGHSEATFDLKIGLRQTGN